MYLALANHGGGGTRRLDERGAPCIEAPLLGSAGIWRKCCFLDAMEAGAVRVGLNGVGRPPKRAARAVRAGSETELRFRASLGDEDNALAQSSRLMADLRYHWLFLAPGLHASRWARELRLLVKSEACLICV